MSKNAWFEHFKDQLGNIEEEYSTSGHAGSLLNFALTEQRLDLETYLNWAMTYYCTAYIQSDFFIDSTPSKDFYAKWEKTYLWTAECLPIAEWDNSLLIACLEPPTHFPQQLSHSFLLASPNSLNHLWSEWKTKAAQGPLELPNSDSKPEIKNNAEDIFSFDDLSSEFTTDENNGENEQAESEVSIVNDLLADFINENNANPIVSLTKVDHLATANVTEPVASQEPPTIELKKNEDPQAMQKATLDFNKPELSVLKSQSAQVNNAPGSDFALDTIKNVNQDFITSQINQILGSMKQYFEKSLILTNNSNESTLKVFAWDSKFNTVSEKNTTFPLGEPSIFSIVSKTQKPFHGFISINDINEKFFDTWNQGHIPDHVTIVPLLFQQRLVGMLMGFAEKSAYNRTTLQFAETLAKKMFNEQNAA